MMSLPTIFGLASVASGAAGSALVFIFGIPAYSGKRASRGIVMAPTRDQQRRFARFGHLGRLGLALLVASYLLQGVALLVA